MKNWIGFAIFCAIVWYCANRWGWFDWVNATEGPWYETKQMFNRDVVKQRHDENQRRINGYQ